LPSHLKLTPTSDPSFANILKLRVFAGLKSAGSVHIVELVEPAFLDTSIRTVTVLPRLSAIGRYPEFAFVASAVKVKVN
ncbi:hypothetical protein, partial [Bacillus cereus]|uniref:hypothetical protein n=1 Tax=Bacillus cereus TaxID=1396 RepID=UPI0015CF6B25